MAGALLLDSDVLVWELRGQPPIVELLWRLAQENVLACSALSVFEVWSGVLPGQEAAVERLFEAVRALPVDDAIARQGAEYWRRFRRQGVTLGKVDAMIAATARVHRLVLLTYNRAHYPMRDVTFFDPMPPLA